MVQADHRSRVKPGYNPGIYWVESQTRPGKAHMCNALTAHCTCEAGKNGRKCWHLGIVRQIEAWKAVQAVH